MLTNKEQEIIIFKKLNSKDITLTPFKTYKEWDITIDNFISHGISFRDSIFNNKIGIDCKIDKVSINESHLNYLGIKRSFYDKDMYNPNLTIGTISEFAQTRELNGRLFLISIPQRVFGERIKPGSVRLYQGSGQHIFYDDTIGNLYYNQYTSSIVDSKNLISCIDFNEYYYKISGSAYSGPITDNLNYVNEITASNLFFNDGVYGTAANLNSNYNSYIQIKNSDELNFTIYDDYTLSFWLKLPSAQVVGQDDINNNYDIFTKYGNNMYSGYPFHVFLDSSNYLNFEISDTINKISLTTTSSFNDDTYHHIVVTKSGSILNTDNFYNDGYQIVPRTNPITNSKLLVYIDGQFNTSASLDNIIDIYNKSDIFIGTNGLNASFLSASIDEIRMYKRGLSAQEVNNLYFTKNNSAKVGNVFYEQGKIVLTAPLGIFAPTGSYDFETNDVDIDFEVSEENLNFEFFNNSPYLHDDFNLFFKSQHTIYEREIICNIRDNEYNHSLNKSLRLTENQKDTRLKSFATSSNFSPYITTVGLYNDNLDLLAIAKLARPIRSERNSDINIIVKFDM